MARVGQKFWDRWLHRAMQRRWAGFARAASGADLSVLRVQRQQARQLKGQLDRLLHVADSRLGLPRIGSNTFDRPIGTQWGWRPQLWRGPITPRGLSGAETRAMLGDEVQLFHDCKQSEVSLHQIRNTREGDLAPFALRMDVFAFDGSFLSLVLDLPPDAVADLKRIHLVRLSSIITTERPIEMFARLNIKQGPNTDQLVLQLKANEPECVIEFDLAYANLNDRPIEKVWLDLIFEGPAMNQIEMRDMTFCRYPRAAM